MRASNSLAAGAGDATLSQVFGHALDRRLHVIVGLPAREGLTRDALMG